MKKKLIFFVLVFSLLFLTGWTCSIRKANLEGKIVFCNLDGHSYLMDLSTGRMKRIPIKKTYNTVFSPDQKKIAYNNRKGLWIANIDGSEQTLLTDKGRDTSCGSIPQPIAWFPDGKRIAFYTEISKGTTYVIDVDGTNEKFVKKYGFWGWSEDGRIIYRKYHPLNERIKYKVQVYVIYAIDPDTKAKEALASIMKGSNIRNLSPDEEKVIFIRSEKAPYYKNVNDWLENIYITDVTDVNRDKAVCLTPIKEKSERPKEKYDRWGLQWSPDGKKIFYFRQMKRWIGTQYIYRSYRRLIYPYSLMMMNPDGSEKTVVKRFRFWRI